MSRCLYQSITPVPWLRLDKGQPSILASGQPAEQSERGVELNALFNVRPTILLQPAIQYYANVAEGRSAPWSWIPQR